MKIMYITVNSNLECVLKLSQLIVTILFIYIYT